MVVAGLVASMATVAGACASFGVETGPSTVGPEASVQGDAIAPDDADGGGVGLDGSGPRMPDAGRCPVGGAFGAATLITIQGGLYNVESARFSADGTLAHLALFPIAPGNKDDTALYEAQLLSTGTYTTPTPLPGIIQSHKYDSSPTLSPDLLHLVFATNRDGVLKLYASDRAAPNGQFGALTSLLLPNQNTRIYADNPYLLANGATMYFAAASNSGNDWQLFRSTGGPPDYMTKSAKALTGISPMPNVAPVVTEDEEEIFFASDRGGTALDLWVMQHKPAGLPYEFQNEQVLNTLSTSGIDYPVWVSPDACDLYFIRKNGQAGQLYVAHRK